jgi:2-polyprenyl-3-methyl-5-hydroxy-6-metoxy-1,4-benzoquinol methylase
VEQEHWDKYARGYHEHVISPLRPGVKNPLYADLAQIPHAKNLIAGDIGCGCGELLPLLAGLFKHVHAIDFSPEMLAIARERCAAANVTFRQHDARALGTLGLRLDVAIAVNSVLQPRLEDVRQVLREINTSIAPNGILLGIFPSMEAVAYHGMLVFEREYAKHGDEKRALRNARRIAERRKYSFLSGVYDEGGERQKLYYKAELIRRLEEAGFSIEHVGKVSYPWDANGGFEQFHGETEMWDWYVRARRGDGAHTRCD